MTKIKIAHVLGGMNTGGAETFIMNVFRNIDHNVVEFHFIISNYKVQAYEEEIIKMGGVIHRVPRMKPNIFKHASELYKLMRKEDFDVIHRHSSSSIVYIDLLLAMLCRIPIRILHSHNTNTENSFFHRLFRVFSFSATHRIACSYEAGQWMYAHKNFEVIKNGIDLEKFVFNQQMREKMRLEYDLKDKYIIGIVGRMSEQKNPLFIVDVFSELKKINEKAFLVWCGEGELRQDIERRIKEYDLERDVNLVGAVSNVNEYMQMFDVLLFPSLWEGLPLVLIEAQTSSLQCFISESISQEAMITDLIHKISLRENAKLWALEINKYKNEKRVNRSKEIRDKGYDIKDTVKHLLKIYLSSNSF